MAKKAVFCIAGTEEQAIAIANSLKAQGFSNNDIAVLFPDRTGTRDFAHEQHTKAPEGAATGAVAGGVLAGALGWLVGIGSLAIPGVGPLIAAGPILAALTGAAPNILCMIEPKMLIATIPSLDACASRTAGRGWAGP